MVGGFFFFFLNMYAGFCWYERPSSFCFKKFYCHIGIPFLLLPFSQLTCFGFLVCFDFQSNLQSPHMQTFGLPQFEFSPMCMYISHSAYNSDRNHKKAFNSPKVNICIY